MTSRAMFVAALSVLGFVMVSGQGGGQTPPAPPTDSVATDIPGVVAAGTKIHPFKINNGGSEGPVVLPDGGIAFTERTTNRVFRIGMDDTVSLLVENPGGALGMGVDPKGRLIATLTAPPGKARIGVIHPKGQEAVLASTCDGVQINRPNDLIVSTKGGVYYTDPGPSDAEVADGYPKSEGIVCYIAPGAGKAVKVAGNIQRPNGIQLSPDEKTLYVTNGPLWSAAERRPVTFVMAFDVEPDGSLNSARPFARTGADGMAVDTAGRLYVAVPPSSYRPDEILGVRVYNPDGRLLGTIPTGLPPNSVAFGGPDKRTLYIVGRRSGLQKIRLLSQGIQSRAK